MTIKMMTIFLTSFGTSVPSLLKTEITIVASNLDEILIHFICMYIKRNTYKSAYIIA